MACIYNGKCVLTDANFADGTVCGEGCYCNGGVCKCDKKGTEVANFVRSNLALVIVLSVIILGLVVLLVVLLICKCVC